MENTIKNSEQYRDHFPNMSIYAQEAEKKGEDLYRFLSHTIYIDDDVAEALVKNWNPNAPQGYEINETSDTDDEHKKYKTFWPRFWAGWVDGIVLMPIVWFFNYLEKSIQLSILVLLVAFTGSLLPHIYNVILHGKYGQTVGKYLFGVKVLDITESKLSYKQSLLRDSVPIFLGLLAYAMLVPNILDGTYPFDQNDPNLHEKVNMLPMIVFAFVSFGWFFLEVATMLMNKKRRAIHDFIARSVVTNIS